MLPHRGAARHSKLDRACAGQARSEDDGRCTRKRENAHRTERREVLYPFHPWGGCIVHIHEVMKRTTGDFCRCSRQGHATDRCLELPMWMFDRAECAAVRVEAKPHVHLGVLSALVGLLSRAVGDGDNACAVPSNATVADVARISHDPNRGGSHASSSQFSPGRSKHHGETIRSLRPSDQRQRRSGTTAVADATRRGASGANKPLGPPNPRSRKR